MLMLTRIGFFLPPPPTVPRTIMLAEQDRRAWAGIGKSLPYTSCFGCCVISMVVKIRLRLTHGQFNLTFDKCIDPSIILVA